MTKEEKKKNILSIHQIIILRKTIASFFELKIYLRKNKQRCRLLEYISRTSYLIFMKTLGNRVLKNRNKIPYCTFSTALWIKDAILCFSFLFLVYLVVLRNVFNLNKYTVDIR